MSLMREFTPSNLASFICPHVFTAERPILFVVHDEGDWQFLCGCELTGDTPGHLVGVGHLVERDPSINECADLPDGWYAERESPSHPWVRGSL